MKFYHLTTAKALSDILEHGLKPKHSASSQTAIYLTDCQFTAENYANMKDEDCVLLQIDIDALQYTLMADDYELRDMLLDMSSEELQQYSLWEGATYQDCSWLLSLSICNQIACYNHIEPEKIEVLKTIFKK